MKIEKVPNISSFVIRFVINPSEQRGEFSFHGAIRHIQTDEEISFSEWKDAENFIQSYVPIDNRKEERTKK